MNNVIKGFLEKRRKRKNERDILNRVEINIMRLKNELKYTIDPMERLAIHKKLMKLWEIKYSIKEGIYEG